MISLLTARRKNCGFCFMKVFIVKYTGFSV